MEASTKTLGKAIDRTSPPVGPCALQQLLWESGIRFRSCAHALVQGKRLGHSQSAIVRVSGLPVKVRTLIERSLVVRL